MEIDTLCLHSKNIKDEYGAINTPIYQSATFVHNGIDDNGAYSYSRLANPTRAHVENTVMELEGGKSCVAFSSGMAAITAVSKLFKSGDHIIACDDLYGGALRLFNNFSRLDGIEFDFIDTSNIELLKSKITINTKAIYIETPSNPLMHVTDIREVSFLAKRNNILLIVDNTFLTPFYQRPLELGADIVIHSGTKYLGGHNDALAGFVVTNDIKLGEKIIYISKTIGANLSPFDSFLIERGIKTLAIRMERINENAIKLANWLNELKEVNKVYYVGLKNHKGYEINKKQSTGYGGMISIELESEELALKILKNVKIFQYAESLGGVDSLITYPMKQTHADVPEEERIKRGINNRFLRISVGIENINDLINDLKEAIYG